MSARPELEYYLVAESHAVDQTTNRVSIFNVLETLTSGQEFASIPQITAVSAWNVPDECIGEDFLVQLRLHAPDGSAKVMGKIAFTGKAPRQRLFQNVFGIKLETAGRWNLEMQLDGVHVANHSIDVRLNSPELVQKLRGSPTVAQ